MGPRKRGRPLKGDYLTTSQAADWLADRGYRVDPRTVARACDRGEIVCYRTPGGYRRILESELEQFLVTKVDTGDSRV